LEHQTQTGVFAVCVESVRFRCVGLSMPSSDDFSGRQIEVNAPNSLPNTQESIYDWLLTASP
jgi:hypothetical protein